MPINNITLNIGQGSEADIFLSVLDVSNTTLGSTLVTPINPLLDFVETDFLFSSPLLLSEGSYSVQSNYTITGVDSGSFWAANGGTQFEMRISGDLTTSSVPAPAALWLVGSGLIGLIGMRKRSLKAFAPSA